MAKSALDNRFAKGNALINQIREQQMERLRRVGDLWTSTMADWEDLAKAEDSVHREYRGRYLFELLQNAYDAIIDGFLAHDDEEGFPGWNSVHFELTEQSLLVANFGMPFRENNIRSICRLHHTTKSTSKQIGHKGIGFKSVLEITEAPEVYSDCYAFGFNRQKFASQVSKIVGDSSLDQTSLPVLRAPYIRRLSRLSAGERERIEALFQQEYVTVIRLPLKSRELLKDIANRMRDELQPELLIFLDYIDKLTIRYPSGKEVEYSKEIRSKNADGSQEVLLWSKEKGGELYIKSRWLKLPTKEIPIDDRELVQGLGDAWQDVHAVRCSVAFPLTSEETLDTDPGLQRFHVYFPTEESCGLRFLVNADFYIEAARKDVRRNPLNDRLASELALHIAIDGVEVLRERFPRDARSVDILAPTQRPDRQFGAFFYEQYLSALSESSFVPLVGGQYKVPSEIRFPPEGSDTEQFRRFFPPSSLRGQSGWAFPMLEVEERELARRDGGRPFLLLDEMGAKQIEVGEILDVLRDGPPVSKDEQGEFLRFLAHWRNDLRWTDRQKIVDALSECAIVPTQSGWRCPSDTLIFQANLREEKDLQVPAGFDFELVPLEVYGEERSYRGVPAQFLEEIGVSPYQTRDILRRAILPVLRSPERFQTLIEHYPSAIYEAYAFLKNYFEAERTTAGFGDDLPRIPVPAFCLQSPSEHEWKPAAEVYFSAYWTGDDDLETIYGSFDNVYFLEAIEELDGLEGPERKQSWYQFFAWLGVSNKPRVVEQGGKHSWQDAKSEHAFCECPLWDKYLSDFEEAFDCNNPHKDHGRSRRMEANWALDRFEEIVSRAKNDVGLLMRLFRSLGRHWDEYRRCLSTHVNCQYISTGCPSGKIPSYLAYCLQKLAWIPAVRWEELAASPFHASDIWNLGDDVRPEVRRMLPSLPEQFRGEEYRGVRADLLTAEVVFEDYLDLLQRLPELCPLEPVGWESDTLKKWQEAARAVFNWLGQAVQNSLARMGAENWPQCPEHLRVLAYRGDAPCYVTIDAPNLVYPDDPFLAKVWSDDLLYLKIDRSWMSFRDWLDVPKLSDCVHPEIQPSADLVRETEQIRKRYEETLPYFLGLVSVQQNSRFDRVLPRMRRLDVHVVEELMMQQTFPGLELPPKKISESAYLLPRDDPNPKGGRQVRAGDLYIVRAEIDNPYILGNYIANYIEIEGLSDAFIVLYGNAQSEERMRYLHSRGVDGEHVQHAAQQLQMGLDEDSLSPGYDNLMRAFKDQGSVTITLPEPGAQTSTAADIVPGTPLDAQPPDYSDKGAGELDSSQQEKPRELPPLDTSGKIGVETYHTPTTPPPFAEETGKQWRSGGGGSTGGHHFLSEEERTRLGERGEEWAYAAERERLEGLGLDPDALERKKRLEWVSSRDKYAKYDIRSVNRVDGQLEEIYIEVKSTSGQDRTVQWSIGEFQLAYSAGDRYWLYWVAHVDRKRPNQPIRYQNPIRLWNDGYIQLGFRQLEIILPEELEADP